MGAEVVERAVPGTLYGGPGVTGREGAMPPPSSITTATTPITAPIQPITTPSGTGANVLSLAVYTERGETKLMAGELFQGKVTVTARADVPDVAFIQVLIRGVEKSRIARRESLGTKIGRSIYPTTTAGSIADQKAAAAAAAAGGGGTMLGGDRETIIVYQDVIAKIPVPGFLLHEGSHDFYFTYTIPDSAPPSYVTITGPGGTIERAEGGVSYSIDFAVIGIRNDVLMREFLPIEVLPGKRFTEARYVEPPVHNEAVRSFMTGKVIMRSTLSHRTLIPGETLILSLDVHNRTYGKRIHRFDAKLMRRVSVEDVETFMTKSGEKTTTVLRKKDIDESITSTTVYELVRPHDRASVVLRLEVPRVIPPSVSARQVISQEYSVVMSAENGPVIRVPVTLLPANMPPLR